MYSGGSPPLQETSPAPGLLDEGHKPLRPVEGLGRVVVGIAPHPRGKAPTNIESLGVDGLPSIRLPSPVISSIRRDYRSPRSADAEA